MAVLHYDFGRGRSSAPMLNRAAGFRGAPSPRPSPRGRGRGALTPRDAPSIMRRVSQRERENGLAVPLWDAGEVAAVAGLADDLPVTGDDLAAQHGQL